MLFILLTAKVTKCVEEVKYYVHISISSRFIPALDGGVLKSDDCVESSLRRDLQRATAAMRRDSANSTCSSPGIADIVDPYLFPFVFAKTKTLRDGNLTPNNCISSHGKGEAVKRPSDEDCVQKGRPKYPNNHAWSNRFQWLPFDVQFDERGAGASRYDILNEGCVCVAKHFPPPSIISYINNVHPHTHRSLYRIIETLIDSLIPVFNHTLVDLKAPGWQNQRMHLAVLGRDPMIKREPDPFRPPEQRALDWLDHHGRYQEVIFVDLMKEFWNIGVQMVLQLRDINLTPEEPNYEGEPWHIQGQNNERICATAHYIYSTDNLSSSTPPTISFRRRINPEEAGLARGYIFSPPYPPEIYGAEDGDPAIQHIGDVKLREGRLVVHPNTFQIRLNKFSLADASEPGHCRLLMLHLLDPNRRNMSTAMVPCQRRDWWAREIRQRSPRMRRLPMEIFDKIIGMVDGDPMSMAEAEELRIEFLEEREEYRRQHTKSMEAYLGWDLRGLDDE